MAFYQTKAHSAAAGAAPKWRLRQVVAGEMKTIKSQCPDVSRGVGSGKVPPKSLNVRRFKYGHEEFHGIV